MEGNFSADRSQGDGFRIIQVHYLYCAPYFCYYYLSSNSDHQALSSIRSQRFRISGLEDYASCFSQLVQSSYSPVNDSQTWEGSRPWTKNFLKESGLAGRVSVRRVTDGKTHGGCREVGCLRSLGSNWDVIMIRWNVEMMGNLETAETQKSRGEGVIDIRTSQ